MRTYVGRVSQAGKSWTVRYTSEHGVFWFANLCDLRDTLCDIYGTARASEMRIVDRWQLKERD